MTTRSEREKYINNLILTENQKNKFKRTNLNVNTIQKVVIALRGRRERNVRINGILNALLSENRRPLNNLLNQYNTRQRANTTPNNTRQRANTTPNNTRQRANTTPNNTRQRANTTPNNTRQRANTTPNNTRQRANTTPNNTRQRANTTPNATTSTRPRREGAGFAERTLMAPGELYDFFQLMKEYEEKRGKVTRPKALPMPKLKEMFTYKQKMCELAQYPYNGDRKLFRDTVDNIRSLCADEGGNYTTFPVLNQPNADKTYELMTMCKRSEFDKLMADAKNSTGRLNSNVLLKLSAIYDKFLGLLKDVDAEVALRLYVKNPNSPNLNTYIRSLSPNIQRSLTQNVSNEYRSLINKLNKRVRNKNHNPIPVAVDHGPANHNTLSVSSMRKILRNPDVIKYFTEGSLFLKYLNEHIPSGGTGGCKMRGDVDGCLLRRRVVFGQPYPTSSSGVKAIQTALSAINHGRMHRLKTFSQNGNRTNRVGEPKKNFTNFGILKKYMNTMKNKSVRNVPLFTSPTNRLLEIQKGNRDAVKFNGTKLVKFKPATDIENPHILWTTFGLHLEERGTMYNFFDFINFIYDRDNGIQKNIESYMRPRGEMGMNYIIQLDSKTLDYLHNKYFFTNFTGEEYKNEIIEKLSSCRR
jgi:hypothetical protein